MTHLCERYHSSIEVLLLLDWWPCIRVKPWNEMMPTMILNMHISCVCVQLCSDNAFCTSRNTNLCRWVPKLQIRDWMDCCNKHKSNHVIVYGLWRLWKSPLISFSEVILRSYSKWNRSIDTFGEDASIFFHWCGRHSRSKTLQSSKCVCWDRIEVLSWLLDERGKDAD